MMDILHFILGDFWHFIGTLLIIYAVGEMASLIIRGRNG